MADLINIGTSPGDGTGDTLRGAMTKINGALGVDGIPSSPAYLKTLSDMANGDPISAFRFIPSANISAIRDHTSSYDVTADLQTGLDALADINGGTLHPMCGKYNLSDTLLIDTSGVSICGESMYKTLFSRATDYGDTVLFTGNDTTGAQITDIGLSNVGFRSTGPMLDAHLKINGAWKVDLHRLYFDRGFRAMELLGLTAAQISKIYAVMTSLNGSVATNSAYALFGVSPGAYAHPHCGDVFMTDFNLRANMAATVNQFGILVQASDGIWFSNGHVGNTTVANCNIQHNSNTWNTSLVFFNNVMFDEGTGINILIDGSQATSKFTSVELNQCNIKGGAVAQRGIVVSGGCDIHGLKVRGGTIWQHLSHGVDLASTASDEISFEGVTVRGNSYGSAGTAHGYNIAAGVSGVSIIGGRAGGDDITVGGAGEQGYGIRIASGAGDNINVQGVDVRLNTTGDVQNFATGDNVRFGGMITNRSNVVASAAAIQLPETLDQVYISGTTTINTITASWRDREVRLLFQSTAAVSEAGNVKLAGTGTFTATADDSLELMCDGTSWIEVGRSVN
jgi:hypothetical protein